MTIRVNPETEGGSTLYRGRCASCGFATVRFTDAVWASVVGARHRCR